MNAGPVSPQEAMSGSEEPCPPGSDRHKGDTMKTRHSLAIALLTGASTLAIAGMAAAQTQPAQTEPEQVVVTGSRIISNGNDMPTPVTIVSSDELLNSVPKSIMDGLADLPIFDGGRSPQTNVGNSSQNNASHQFNIRNVGITRTLVLYDGRRIAPTSPTGEVDADIIPQMLLQRVDVVTGGVSAVYGSDAVAGVVNFITDKNFNGVKFDGHVGVSEYGDDVEERVGVAGGMNILGGRGHIEGSLEYYNNPGVAGADKLQRPWNFLTRSSQGAASAKSLASLCNYTRLESSSYGGYISSGGVNKLNTGNPYADYTFNADGSLRPFVHGSPSGTGNVTCGPNAATVNPSDGIYYQEASLVASSQMVQAFGRFDYSLTDDISAYAELTRTQIQNNNVHQTNEIRNVTLSATDAFLDPTVSANMVGAGKSTFNFSRAFLTSPPLQSNSWTTSYLADAGLKGHIFGDYTWELSYVHNENSQNTKQAANMNLPRLYAALDAVKDGSGNIVCNVTITNPGLYPGCVPLNPFGVNPTTAMLSYFEEVTQFTAVTKMDNVGGSITGPIIDLWAGPLQGAFSGEWRQMDLTVNSNRHPSDPVDCTGLRFNCSSSTLIDISNILENQPGASQSVWELAAEFELPILKDRPLAEAVSINAAARYTDYDTSGAVWTWKVGGQWSFDEELTARAVISLDIRAPNLNELFAPQLVNPAGTSDYHVLTPSGGPTQLQAPFITIANPNLKPEESHTVTMGAVYRPSWLDNFSLAVDYYHLKIANAITNIQGQNATIQQICEASNGTSDYCSLIQRPLPFSDHSTNNLVTAFYQQPRNAQSLETDGWSIEANWATQLWGHDFSVRDLTEYQPMLKTISFPGAPVTNAANTGALPSWRSTFYFRYTWDDWSAQVTQKFRGGGKLNADRTKVPYYSPSFAEPGIAMYTNLTVNWTWKSAPYTPVQFYVSVQNLFDRAPTTIGGGGTVPGLFPGTFAGDDLIGRYYTTGMRLRF
jgi:outer membrane receptor protein involved in Fe transport